MFTCTPLMDRAAFFYQALDQNENPKDLENAKLAYQSSRTRLQPSWCFLRFCESVFSVWLKALVIEVPPQLFLWNSLTRPNINEQLLL